jgi:ketosteroid isomerase-like protein
MSRSIARRVAVSVVAACSVLVSTDRLVGEEPAKPREALSTTAGGTSHARAQPATEPKGDVVRWDVASDSADVAATVDRFHAALAAGDSTAALALLAGDVVILESGGVETRDEYRSHHLPGDIAFARAVPGKRGPMTVRVRGDVAWVSATSISEGEYRSRRINSTGVELMVLSREGATWKIRAIHWSSRSRRPAGG